MHAATVAGEYAMCHVSPIVQALALYFCKSSIALLRASCNQKMVSKAALTPVVNAAEVGVISDEVFELLGSTVEYHLKDVVQEAMKVPSCC
jgi:TATA box binding protein associated factor (TAF)